MAEWTTAIIERLAKQAEARAQEAAKIAAGEKDKPGGPTAALSSVLAHMHADVMKAADRGEAGRHRGGAQGQGRGRAAGGDRLGAQDR